MVTGIAGKTSKILVLPSTHKADEQEVGAAINDNCVTHLSYGLSRQWGQMVYFTGKETVIFERMAFNYELSSNWFFYEGVNHVIDAGGIFAVHSPNGIWVEIDSTDDLVKTKGLL